MLTARKMFGGLAVLMLSTRAEAFCAFPMSRTSMNVRRAASSTEVSASRSFGSSKCISLRSGASIRRSGSTLRMSAESAGDVKRADLEDREFQVCLGVWTDVYSALLHMALNLSIGSDMFRCLPLHVASYSYSVFLHDESFLYSSKYSYHRVRDYRKVVLGYFFHVFHMEPRVRASLSPLTR